MSLQADIHLAFEVYKKVRVGGFLLFSFDFMNTWGIVKIMVPFWVPIIIRGLIRGLIEGAQKGTIIFTIPHISLIPQTNLKT